MRQFEDALRESRQALSNTMIGRTYRFAEAPHRTFKILGVTETPGKVQILEGDEKRYVELAVLAQCLVWGVVAEVESHG